MNRVADTAPEEISDGDMESDHEEPERKSPKLAQKQEINITHEDLSDVSDLEDSMGGRTEDEEDEKKIDDEKTESDENNIQNKSYENDAKKVMDFLKKWYFN